MKKKIAVISGDGIGPEVVAEGIKVLKHIAALDRNIDFEFTEFPWGCEYYLKHGVMMAPDGLEQLSSFDAILLGAVGYPTVPDHISLWDLLLKIRKGFEQYVNIRPIKLLEGAQTPLKDIEVTDIDMLFIRENSEGEYAGAGDFLFKGSKEEIALQTGVFSRKAMERIIRYAFDLARKSNKKVTSVSKANALNYSMVLWDEVFLDIAKEYPEIEHESLLVDAAAMLMILNPKRFEIVVTSNLFGDILTDLGAALAGGIGLAAGANINPEKKFPSMFESIHGSAPDIAGQQKANPIATIWAVSQMLDYFERPDLAENLLYAIQLLLKEGIVLTPDQGGKASTSEVGDEIVKLLSLSLHTHH